MQHCSTKAQSLQPVTTALSHRLQYRLPFNQAFPFLFPSQIRALDMQAQQSDASLQRMSREQLSSILLSSDASNVAVIDVRGDDHAGGHVHSSTHVPSTSLDYRIPQLVRTLAGKKIVVFHCALSQERGPSAARRYIEAKKKDRMKNQEVADDDHREVDVPVINADSGTGSKKLGKLSIDGMGPPAKVADQEVYILDGGFVKWQEKCATPLWLHALRHFRCVV